MSEEKCIDMTTWDGNIFFIIGQTRKLLRKANVKSEIIASFLRDVLQSKSYEEALAKCIDILEKSGYKICG